MTEPLGVVPSGDGVHVAVFSAHATAIEFCLFDVTGETEIRRVRLGRRSGDVHHDHIPDVPVGARYGLRAHGPFAPAAGHWFNPAKLLIDPYAVALDRVPRWHESMRCRREDDTEDDTDSAPAMPKCIVTAPCDARPGTAFVPWESTVLYELHVRGFTMRHPDIPEALRGTFAGLAHPAAIAHLTGLGVTSVEIMPAAAWIEERHLAALGLANHWGYNPIAWLAPDPRLAPGGWDEVRAAVDALAAAGIETIVDVVLNHTGEGDAQGPMVSLRGLDNASYYQLTHGQDTRYIDDTGCGNTMALDRPAGQRLAMDALRAWAIRGGVHGFRFDLATTMGRRPQGFDREAPLLTAIAQDPVLRMLKLIAEPWDIGPGGYQPGGFPAGWGEWNDRYRDGMRRFWRGDAGLRGELATRLAGSQDLFAAKRHPSRSINFIVAHDGFTLADLVAYTQKHNHANGEDNRDGTEANNSWNNGVEGETEDSGIRAARLRDQRALLASLLFSRGTPMLSMGAELGFSQGGNNNAYAQDNDIAWLDWRQVEPGLIAWVQRLAGLRRNHPALHADQFLSGTGVPPDVEWYNEAGRRQEWDYGSDDILVMLLSQELDRVCVVYNRGGEREITLPEPSDGTAWQVEADSSGPADSPYRIDGPTMQLSARSVVLLAEQPYAPPSGRQGVSDTVLDRLAQAAGIAPHWWEVGGPRHDVSPQTKRALLAAMQFAADTPGDVREGLARLAEEHNWRPLPVALTGHADTEITLVLPVATGFNRRPVRLRIRLEDGGERSQTIAADAGTLVPMQAIDGQPYQGWQVKLTPLPLGRHQLCREDAPAATCHLTVAPKRGFLPPALARGGRRFGIAAQLYSLRHQDSGGGGDQGIGDFTTLGRLAEQAGRAGASVVGLNPLHALFSGQRQRASPYHPSDRRFLDPISLDVSGLAEGVDFSDLAGLAAVDYLAVWIRKRQVLEQAFAAFDTRSSEAFARFVSEGGTALERFAAFEAIAERYPGFAWTQWPEALQTPDGPGVRAFMAAHATELRYHQYLQFLCEQQLAAAVTRGQNAGLEFGFLRDLAVGSAPDGAEAWSNMAVLARGASVGAPPDPFSAAGQIWHLPPPDPWAMAREGFATFAGLLRTNMRHAGALRIDHAMGLSRLFWVPDGAQGADGAYVAAPFEHLLGQVALESQRAACMVVGEDLGTVPDGFREKMTGANILGFRVLLLEREGIGFKPPSTTPACATACVSTHDLPTLAGWWEGADIAERGALGLITPEEAGADHAARGDERRALLTAMGLPDTDDLTPDLAAAIHGFAAGSPAMLALVQAEELCLEKRAVNLPGTDLERPNWRRKLAVPVEQLMHGETAARILEVLRGIRPR